MRLKSKAINLGRVFREYPLTLSCIMIIAAIGAVIVDCKFAWKVSAKGYPALT